MVSPKNTLIGKHKELVRYLSQYPKNVALDQLKEVLEKRESVFENPNTVRFESAYKSLPEIDGTEFCFDQDVVNLKKSSISKETVNKLHKSLQALKPWRKGPFELCSIYINSEWQCQKKWDRIIKSCPDLNNKNILDIGCGNGYYMFRMLDQSPRFILGIDPSDLYFYQFNTINKYIKNNPTSIHYLPLGLEECKVFKSFYDVVFCMGVLYHQWSPVESLKIMKETLKPSGSLILETLIHPSKDDIALYPSERYASMRNVHFIPSTSCLINWCKRAGFKSIDVIDETITTEDEQRSTDWSSPFSLKEMLSSSDKSKTIEGYFRPKRACVVCRK